ncbi:MAG TPA: transporter, partial [Thermoanaerobaculaceae bacterium]|nr:transporter [Thermoanaerobaculaceae bacterium]
TAGPPFLTDDPEPVDYHHWEAYLFSTYDRAAGGTNVQGPAVEFNFGAAPELQLHLVVPWAWSRADGAATRSGWGDIELGVKLRLLDESESSPQVGIFPMAELPTGDASRGLGNGHVWFRLPIWLQKSWGPWTTYGGAGWVVNRAPGERDHAFAGWLLQRELGEKLALGGEVFTEGADAVGGRGSTIANLGGYLDFTKEFSLLFSVGHSVAGEGHTIAYLGLYWTWGPPGAEPDP